MTTYKQKDLYWHCKRSLDELTAVSEILGPPLECGIDYNTQGFARWILKNEKRPSIEIIVRDVSRGYSNSVVSVSCFYAIGDPRLWLFVCMLSPCFSYDHHQQYLSVTDKSFRRCCAWLLLVLLHDDALQHMSKKELDQLFQQLTHFQNKPTARLFESFQEAVSFQLRKKQLSNDIGRVFEKDIIGGKSKNKTAANEMWSDVFLMND